jgi:hypothetical protein
VRLDGLVVVGLPREAVVLPAHVEHLQGDVPLPVAAEDELLACGGGGGVGCAAAGEEQRIRGA